MENAAYFYPGAIYSNPEWVSSCEKNGVYGMEALFLSDTLGRIRVRTFDEDLMLSLCDESMVFNCFLRCYEKHFELDAEVDIKKVNAGTLYAEGEAEEIENGLLKFNCAIPVLAPGTPLGGKMRVLGMARLGSYKKNRAFLVGDVWNLTLALKQDI